jgi:hypothetical protein
MEGDSTQHISAFAGIVVYYAVSFCCAYHLLIGLCSGKIILMAANTAFIMVHNGTIGDIMEYPVDNINMPASDLLDYMYDHPLPPPNNWRVAKIDALLQPLLEGSKRGELNVDLPLKELPPLLLTDKRAVISGKMFPRALYRLAQFG